MNGRLVIWLVAGLAVCVLGQPGAAQPLVDTHWNVQQVDANGNCVHPLVGAPMLDGYGNPIESNKVQLTGVVVADPDDLVDTASQYMLVVQGEGDDHAGTQLWSGIFFHDPNLWPEYPLNVLCGDRVRVTGFIMDFIGKVNMNERHSGNPAVNFQVEVLEHVGMPDPEVVPMLAHANFFDQTRLTGGEWYQSRWVRVNSVEIVGGDTWATGNQVIISDGTGQLGMKLSSAGDFSSYTPPAGKFDVLAVFDQEPHPLNFGASKKANYRVWVKRWADIIQPTEPPALVKAASRRAHGSAGEFDIDLPLQGAPARETRIGGLTTLVLTFNEGIKAIDGTLDASEISLSVGQVDSVTLDGLDLIVQVSGISDGSVTGAGSCVDVTVSGIADLADNALVGDTDVRVVVLAGDINGSAPPYGDNMVDLTDMAKAKANASSNLELTKETCLFDVNVDGGITLTDMALVKSLALKGAMVTCP